MLNNYDLFKLTNILSHTTSSEINPIDIANNNSIIIQDEINTGVDRSRNAIGYSVQLNWLDQISDPSSSAMDIEILSRSMIEIIIRIKNSSKLLFLGMNYILGSTLKSIVDNVDYANIMNLKYMEDYINEPIDESNVISMQDIEQGNIDLDYDTVFLDTELVSHDFNIVDNIWEKLSSGALLILNTVNDFGFLYSSKNQHPYFEYLSRLTQDEDKHVFHIPVATGFTLVVKK
jgi:hypothetical protein